MDNNTNFVSYELDAAGDLYLKYYFADNSETVNESAVGRFSVGDKALEAADNEAIGLPFSVLPRQDLSIKGDWHSWSPKEGATWEDHVEFARGYAPGHIVAMTKDSNLVSAAMSDIKAHNGRLAVVKITDKRARDAYLANPTLIPKQVSPGFMNLETPNLNGIQKVRWAHLAGVPKGAYGEKATLYASCVGGNECINHLVAASVKEIDEKTRQSYCPVGASENLVNNSLGSLSDNQKTMSVNATTTESQSSPTTTPAAPVVSTAPPKGAPITTNTGTSKGIVKLKNPVQTNPNQAVTPQGNNNNQGQGQGDVNELEAVKKTLQELQAAQQQRERLEQIKKVIPKELFINKGKFDEKGYEAEVEKRLQQGWTDEQLNEFYASRSEILKLTNAGYALPNQEQGQQQPGQEISNTPVGGSSYSYKTPSEVPATGENDYDALKLKAVNELRRWTRGY